MGMWGKMRIEPDKHEHNIITKDYGECGVESYCTSAKGHCCFQKKEPDHVWGKFELPVTLTYAGYGGGTNSQLYQYRICKKCGAADNRRLY